MQIVRAPGLVSALVVVCWPLAVVALPTASLFDLAGRPAATSFYQLSEQSIVLLFNPGTSNWRVQQACRPDQNPLILEGLDKTIVAGRRVFAYHLCSQSVGRIPGELTPQRAKEIGWAVDEFLAKGVPAEHVFLVGQSRGAWSAIYYAASDPTGATIGGLVGFVPAIYGPRPISHPEIVEAHVRQFSEAPRLDGLLYSHPRDPFFRPVEHAFAKEIDGLELVTHVCPNLDEDQAHTLAYRACSLSVMDQVRGFIERRVKHAHFVDEECPKRSTVQQHEVSGQRSLAK